MPPHASGRSRRLFAPGCPHGSSAPLVRARPRGRPASAARAGCPYNSRIRRAPRHAARRASHIRFVRLGFVRSAMSDLAARLASVHRRIDEAARAGGRAPGSVTLLAV
ncbi:YggS family pyridoxal phosphate-dependent enzyme, partial [Burkholderia pseudomallei]